MKPRFTLLAILIIIVGFYFFHKTMIRRLIYFPDKTVAESDLARLKSMGFAAYKDRGFVRRVDGADKIVVFFHGNAGNATHRTYMTYGFLESNAVLFLAEYPGYGNREGKPTEDSIASAAKDDINLLKKENPDAGVILVGESLGTGVACRIAKDVDAKGLILVSPFTSFEEVGKIHYPFLPVASLLPDHYDSVTHLKGLNIPLLILHGDNDEIIPYVLGQRLYEKYSGPKTFVTLKRFGHNDLDWENPDSEIWQAIQIYFAAI